MLWRRKIVLIATTLLAVGVSVAASVLTTPVYSATAEVLLGPRVVESPFDPLVGVRIDPARTLANEIRVMTSKLVTDAVRQKIGDAPRISASSLEGTDVIRVTARSPRASRAEEVANAYANAYIDFRRARVVEDLLEAGKQIQTTVTDLKAQIDAAPANSAQRQALIDQQALFKQKLDQLRVDASLKTGGAELVAPAVVPTEPVEPRPVRNGLTALALGLILGVALAFLVEFLDDSVKTTQDIGRVAPRLPVLGLIPTVANWKPKQTKVISQEDPNAGASEAYRTLRTALQFFALERPLGVLQVTSPGALEGKSTTSANLGVALASAGNRVIIACCDLRRPRIHEFFGLDNSVGLTSVLLGKVQLVEAMQPVPCQPRLALLASGPLPPNPSELLASARVAEVIAQLRQRADIVILDCPPLLPVSDSLVVSSRADATLLVSVAGRTTRKDLARAIELLRQVDAPVAGAVLNGVSESGAYGYGYGYGYRSPSIRDESKDHLSASESRDQQAAARS